ncbi:hypothetical protein PVAP13_5NG012585 [Panicum virgatum]|uniref:Uncharacterized protein n=1 Tax=Panicum virgatum TaxID=38727 RepID=A0A8T0SAJ2_PANVG|nr:hypothetical protein PVAP13_5NG012585 [Panicum virgatum]KAG2593707.1 hypothetical protein PVAP13_5NG012585 [Panicum virgatum]KAG2593708.1 hypothetical protein PVAP13_5NG012585 [Panicum virgatum]
MVSETAAEVIAFTNALPEWLCKSRQEKLFSGEALFGHVELLKEGKLFLFPHLHSKGLLAAWKEPCIAICPHWSLRLGPAVHLLRHWRADKRCLLVLEQGNDAELSLKPFTPLVIRVLECSFLPGVRAAKIDTLLEVLKPKFVMLPEGLKSRYSAKERPWSSLYYSKGKTIELPNFQEDFEVHLATDVALGLQPRQLNETTAVARLRTKLFASSGQYQLVAAEKQSDQSKRHLLHRDAVDPDRLLPAQYSCSRPQAALLGRLGRRLAPRREAAGPPVLLPATARARGRKSGGWQGRRRPGLRRPVSAATRRRRGRNAFQ